MKMTMAMGYPPALNGREVLRERPFGNDVRVETPAPQRVVSE